MTRTLAVACAVFAVLSGCGRDGQSPAGEAPAPAGEKAAKGVAGAVAGEGVAGVVAGEGVAGVVAGEGVAVPAGDAASGDKGTAAGPAGAQEGPGGLPGAGSQPGLSGSAAPGTEGGAAAAGAGTAGEGSAAAAGAGAAGEGSAAAAGAGAVGEGSAAAEPTAYEPPVFRNVEEDKLDRRRRSQMLEFLQARYRHKIKDERVLKGMGTVPRHMYMLAEDRDRAYDQMWFKIGYGQTITDPGMVAYMTELIAVKPTDKVLEIGTGSGYQGSVLAQLTPNVFTIEIVEKLALRSHALLDKLGYGPEVIHRKIADGYFGWEEEAPFDKIIVTCAADHVPVPLLQQLKPGGLMVIPVGPRYQPGKLHFVAKDADGKVHTKVLSTVEFVPMTRLVKGKVR